MSDLISRQAAIDVLIEWYGCEPSDIGAFEDIIEKLPSAQPEKRWIPCSERLPEINMSHPHHDNYLVQYDSGYMDVASWSNVNRFWAYHVTDPHWNCAQFAEVIAWMPLPEPYRENEG